MSMTIEEMKDFLVKNSLHMKPEHVEELKKEITEAEEAEEYGVIYNNYYNSCRFKGGSVSVQVYGHGKDTTECKKELTKELDMWRMRYYKASNEGDEEGKKFAGAYIEKKKKELESIRAIKKADYQKELDRVILQAAEEITEDDYFEMLEVLPPLEMGKNYFIMSEFFTGRYTSQFYRKNNKYYHKMIDYTRRETWAIL